MPIGIDVDTPQGSVEHVRYLASARLVGVGVHGMFFEELTSFLYVSRPAHGKRQKGQVEVGKTPPPKGKEKPLYLLGTPQQTTYLRWENFFTAGEISCLNDNLFHLGAVGMNQEIIEPPTEGPINELYRFLAIWAVGPIELPCSINKGINGTVKGVFVLPEYWRPQPET